MLDEVSIGVTDGELSGDESWVCVWLKDHEVLYVGATRLPLGARTWLHLTDDDPAVGKIRAQYPEAMKGRVTVHGWRLPGSVNRASVRDALSAFLRGDRHRHDLKEGDQQAVGRSLNRSASFGPSAYQLTPGDNAPVAYEQMGTSCSG